MENADETKEFKWSNETIVVPQVDAIAVYANGDADIVIRQQHPMGEDDSIIIIPRSHVRAVIAALRTELKQSAS